MQRIKVLVTGSNGQLGNEIKFLATLFDGITFTFSNSTSLDITQKEQVSDVFKDANFDYCINCASYTAVDKAEKEKEQSYKVNVEGVNNLASSCLEHKVKLIQISTDYVFNGDNIVPYLENDKTNPINYYGQTKLLGEQVVKIHLKDFFIIRTSWLYGKKGNNFVKTILKLAAKLPELKVVSDQQGSPTNAKDLAEFIIHLILTNNTNFGTYHFRNDGQTTWYGFAKEILRLTNNKTPIIKVATEMFPTLAKRPKYSVLSIDKVKNTTSFSIRDWTIALRDYIDNNNFGI